MAILSAKKWDVIQMCVPIVLVIFAILTTYFVDKKQLKFSTNITQRSAKTPLNITISDVDNNGKLFSFLRQVNIPCIK